MLLLLFYGVLSCFDQHPFAQNVNSDYETDAVAIPINTFFQYLIIIVIELLRHHDAEQKAFPIPEKLHLCVHRILNDEAANFYQRFDGRTERERAVFMRERDDDPLNEEDIDGTGFDSE